MSGLNHMVMTGGLRPEVDQAPLQVMALFVVHNLYPCALLHIVIDNSSIVIVSSKENVLLSCVEPTAIDTVWLKDRVEMSEQVRVIVVHYQLIIVFELADSRLQWHTKTGRSG